MEQPKPGRGRLARVVLILLVVVVGAAGAGWFYLNAAGNGPKDQSGQSADAAGGTPASGDDASPADSSDDSGTDDAGKKGDDKDVESDKDKKNAAIPVNVAEIRTGTISSYISATANLVAENEVKILAETEGRVESLLVEEGDPVGKEALLAGLVRDEKEIAVQKALVREATARMAFERAESMAAQHMISPEDFDNTTRDYRVAAQELEEARWNLAKTEVRSPFAGKVTHRMVTQGQHVRIGDELFTITDFDPLVARIFLPEKDIVGLNTNRDVRITLKADERIQFDGRIRQISPVVDVSTGTVKLTIEAVSPPGQVRPGGFVTVDIIKETRPDVVVLPREAVVRELQRAHVFVIKDEGKAEKRTVTLGLEEGDHVEILEGVQPGEQVIVAGQGSLKDGSKVKIIPIATAQDASVRKQKSGPVRG
jgi:membrane fusion protein (multidrug efflux system)